MPELHEDLRTKLIVRPDEPRHFMRLLRPEYRVEAVYNGNVIAASMNTIKVVEVARDIYEPVYYFPRSDVSMDWLQLIEGRTTHCPLKGDTEYFDVNEMKEAAWSYNKPLDIASDLKDMIAFDVSQIELRECRAHAKPAS